LSANSAVPHRHCRLNRSQESQARSRRTGPCLAAFHINMDKCKHDENSGAQCAAPQSEGDESRTNHPFPRERQNFVSSKRIVQGIAVDRVCRRTMIQDGHKSRAGTRRPKNGAHKIRSESPRKSAWSGTPTCACLDRPRKAPHEMLGLQPHGHLAPDSASDPHESRCESVRSDTGCPYQVRI